MNRIVGFALVLAGIAGLSPVLAHAGRVLPTHPPTPPAITCADSANITAKAIPGAMYWSIDLLNQGAQDCTVDAVDFPVSRGDNTTYVPASFEPMLTATSIEGNAADHCSVSHLADGLGSSMHCSNIVLKPYEIATIKVWTGVLMGAPYRYCAIGQVTVKGVSVQPADCADSYASSEAYGPVLEGPIQIDENTLAWIGGNYVPESGELIAHREQKFHLQLPPGKRAVEGVDALDHQHPVNWVCSVDANPSQLTCSIYQAPIGVYPILRIQTR